MKTFRSPRDLLAAVDQALAARPAAHDKPLQKVVGLLHHGRHYLWTSVYLCVDKIRLVRVASAGPETHCMAVEPGEGNVGRAAQTGKARVVPDVKADPQYLMSLAATRSELVVPIKITGQVLGVINAESDEPNYFGHEDRLLLEEVAAKLALFLRGRGKYLARRTREMQKSEGKMQK